jgi:hypothetical protein
MKMNNWIVLSATIISVLVLAQPAYAQNSTTTITPQQDDCIRHIVMGLLLFGDDSSHATADNTKAIEDCITGK